MQILVLLSLFGFTSCILHHLETFSPNENLGYFSAAGWPSVENSQSVGDYRAVISVESYSETAHVVIPWRRRDPNPQQIDVFIVNANTEQLVPYCNIVQINREIGEFLFEPSSGPGEYFVYYMPFYYKNDNYYDDIGYDPPNPSHCVLGNTSRGVVREATFLGIQAATYFSRNDPMEVIATAAEVASLVQKNAGKKFMIFPEERRFPVRMRTDIPQRWAQKGLTNTFTGIAQMGEYYTFQLGIFAPLTSSSQISLTFQDLVGPQKIPKSNWYNLNGEYVDYWGRQTTKTLNITKGAVESLWIALTVPLAVTGVYTSTITVTFDKEELHNISIRLHIEGPPVKNNGTLDIWRNARTAWFSSRLALDGVVPSPYIPLVANWNSQTLSLLDKVLHISNSGFPDSIKITAPRVNNSDIVTEVLAQPVSVQVKVAGKVISWTPQRMQLMKNSATSANWVGVSSSGAFTLTVNATIDFTGFLEYSFGIKCSQSQLVDDVNLVVPIAEQVAEFFMGYGNQARYRTGGFNWKWNTFNGDNIAWLGTVTAGLRLKLRGPEDMWESPIPYNDVTALNPPESWYNSGKGGALLGTPSGGVVSLTAYTGPRTWKANQEIQFQFSLLMSPLKRIDDKRWNLRFVQVFYNDPDFSWLSQNGATIANLHQGNDANPWINYPYLTDQKLADMAQSAHSNKMQFSIYNTMRELSYRAQEIWQMRSYGDVYMPGPAGGTAWLQEHLVDNYFPGWTNAIPDGDYDIAVRVLGLSRWNNYYVEGLNYLFPTVDLDGLYLDECIYDHKTMARVRRVLDQYKPGTGILDMHSNDYYYSHSPVLTYMELLPFLDRLWYGEQFDYQDEPPEYWLVEISGIPFGLNSDMLIYSGQGWQHRGMLFGSANRWLPNGNQQDVPSSPVSLWAFWASFGISDAVMYGWWEDSVPITSNCDDIKITSYVREGQRTLISIGSWTTANKSCSLEINWKAIGLNQHTATLVAPPLSFQQPAKFRVGDLIPIVPYFGWLIVVS